MSGGSRQPPEVLHTCRWHKGNMIELACVGRHRFGRVSRYALGSSLTVALPQPKCVHRLSSAAWRLLCSTSPQSCGVVQSCQLLPRLDAFWQWIGLPTPRGVGKAGPMVKVADALRAVGMPCAFVHKTVHRSGARRALGFRFWVRGTSGGTERAAPIGSHAHVGGTMRRWPICVQTARSWVQARHLLLATAASAPIPPTFARFGLRSAGGRTCLRQPWSRRLSHRQR